MNYVTRVGLFQDWRPRRPIFGGDGQLVQESVPGSNRFPSGFPRPFVNYLFDFRWSSQQILWNSIGAPCRSICADCLCSFLSTVRRGAPDIHREVVTLAGNDLGNLHAGLVLRPLLS